jgi:plasmid stabilization system protein ParE
MSVLKPHKRRVVLAPAARLDLQDVLRYTTRQWGRRQRAIYKQALYRGFDELARHPLMGKEQPEYGEYARSFLLSIIWSSTLSPRPSS